MKKKLVSTLFLAVLVIPSASAQYKYRSMSAIETIEDLAGADFQYCRSRNRCEIPYQTVPIRGNKAEKARRWAQNLAARDAWILANIDKFKQSENQMKLEEYKEKHEDLVEAYEESKEKFNEIGKEKERLSALLASDGDASLSAKKSQLEQSRDNLVDELAKQVASLSSEDMSTVEFYRKKREIEKIKSQIEDKEEEIKEAQTELVSVKSKYDELEAQALTAQGEMQSKSALIESLEASVSDEMKGREAAFDKKSKKLARLRDEKFVNALVEDIKDDSKMAETLMGNFDDLKSDLKMTKIQANLLETALKSEYDKSLLKRLVQTQITDSITSACPAVSSCIQGAVSDLERGMKDVEKETEKETEKPGVSAPADNR